MKRLKIVSGGQTGVDRAALDVALDLGIPCGGWCPHGRTAEDGIIPSRYPVSELPSGGYAERTEKNVQDSDGTLIISTLPMTGGTLLTANLAHQYQKPLFLIDIDSPSTQGFQGWIEENRIHVLNVAGPRESTVPGIYEHASVVMRGIVLSQVQKTT